MFSPAGSREAFLKDLRARRKTKVQPSQRNRRKKFPKRKPGLAYDRQAYAHAIAKGCDRAFLHPTLAPLPIKDLTPEQRERYRELRRLYENKRLSRERRREYRIEMEDMLMPRDQRTEWNAWRKAHHLKPNQIRHAYATRIRRDYGLEAAQVLLGHSKADVTQIYAERDLEKAVEIAKKIG